MAFSLFAGRLEVLWLLVGQIVYVYYVVLRLRKGLPRLLALLPVFPPMFIIPWRGQTGPERVLYSFLFHWTIMSKLLLLVWGAGPAADPHATSTFSRFFSAMTFSLHLKRDRRFISRTELEAAAGGIESSLSAAAEDDREGSSLRNGAHPKVSNSLSRRKAKSGMGKEKKDDESNGVSIGAELLLELQRRAEMKEKVQSSFLRWVEIMVNSQDGRIVLLRSVLYFIVDASLIRTVIKLSHVLPIYVLNLLLSFTVYFSCLVLFESPAGICACLLGAKLHPQFNMPFLADSLADFWGRRWNLLINNLLRVSVYEPTLSFLIQRKEKKNEGKQKMKIKASPLDRAIGTAAAFTVSGLAHEFIFFYLNKTRPTGEMTAFFLVNGAGTIVEGLVKPRERFGMPRLLGWAYTLTFVYVAACWLFFPPILRTGMVDQCLEDLRAFTDWIAGLVVGGGMMTDRVH